MRFTEIEDLDLLRAVISENPVEHINRWSGISQYVDKIAGKQFTIKSLKDYLEYLVKQFLQRDKVNISKYVFL